jgi:signal recognition particle receptor subunit beta
MAYIDPDSGELTLRIVYDGVPGAGKTTNVRVLHETLFSARRGSLAAPGSAGRRTEFFDWRALEGGYLDGRPVRLHVVSVPGQWSLRARRRLLLRSADAVCFVAEASASRMAAQARMLATLREIVPDVEQRLVLQVNKLDVPGALAPARVSAELGLLPSVRVLPARAHQHEGVSETFLTLTRLATSTLREAEASGTFSPVAIALTPEELHEEMLGLEDSWWHARDDDDAPLEEDWSEAGR